MSLARAHPFQVKPMTQIPKTVIKMKKNIFLLISLLPIIKIAIANQGNTTATGGKCTTNTFLSSDPYHKAEVGPSVE